MVACGAPASGFASTVNDTRRLPVPAPPAGSVMRTHDALVTASHPQPTVAATSNEPFPPETPKVSPLREMSSVQMGTGNCVTTCDALPTLMAPVRCAASPLTNTRYATRWLPVPEPPLTMVIHGTVGVAVQVQAASVVTVKPDSMLAPASVAWPDPRVYVQVRPCCVTDTDWPATVSEPVREADPLLAAAVKAKVPGPVPDVPPAAVSQEAPELAVHAHPLPAVIDTDPGPPAAPIEIDVADSVKVQEGSAGLSSQPARQPRQIRAKPRARTRECMERSSPNTSVCAPCRGPVKCPDVTGRGDRQLDKVEVEALASTLQCEA